MGNAKYIGRVGGLAVALGVGMAIANTPAVAFAEPADSGAGPSSDSSPSSSSPDPGPTSSTSSSASTDDPPGRHRGRPGPMGPLNPPGGMAVSSSGGVHSVSLDRQVRRAGLAAPAAVAGTGGAHTGPPTRSPFAGTDAPTADDRSEPDSTAPTAAASIIATPETLSVPRPKLWPIPLSPTPGRHAPPAAASAALASIAAQTTSTRAAMKPPAAPTANIDATRVVADAVQAFTPTTPSMPVAAITPVTTHFADIRMVPRPPAPATTTTTAMVSTPVNVVAGMVSGFVNTVLSPLGATTAPGGAPAQTPALWTLAAFARREFEQTPSIPSAKLTPMAGPITVGALTSMTGAPPTGVSTLTPETQPSVTAAAATFAGEPSIVAQVVTAAARALRVISDITGVDIVTQVLQLTGSDSPPPFLTQGLNVQRSEFDGMPVYTISSPNPSGKYVVALHGGGYVVQANVVLEWPDYARMVRDTGATVVVPIYPLVPEGTAGTVVPVMADLISAQIDQHGAENVSVYGVSAGGNLALTSVQELVRRGDPVPSHMVLLSPGLDASLSNPAIPSIDDPLVSASLLSKGQQWAGDLDLTDPLVSPLYGSLAGLPPTAVYAGSVDVVAPDVLLLQDKALATPGADFTFVLREGELHAWAALWFLPEAQAVRPDIYQQLGIGSNALSSRSQASVSV
ncbi:MAG: triacylglycerol lipase [Mycobacterium sp.]|nr:triacylglycerol lipase [Mycobacterium sp.]